MPTNSFPYIPLKGSEIRYITLHAFDDSIDQVQCTLRQTPLENLDFTALSYVWGNPDVTATIQLSGMPFSVTTNLEACLRQFASNRKFHGLSLWVDAICINQGDIDERNVQVWRMKDIYSVASSVWAWIGPSTPLSRVGMQRIGNIPASIDPESDPGLHSLDPGISKVAITKALEGDGAEGIQDVFLRPYWKRAWVVQELFLGKDTRVVCGDDEVPLQRFYALDTLAFRYGKTSKDPWPPGSPITRPPRVLQMANYSRRPLSALLGATNRLRCSDPRDKVYCLLGMTESCEAESIVPDYARPTQKVYGDVVQSQLELFDNLNILHSSRYDDKRGLSYPTWIPDWSDESEGNAATFFCGNVENGAYRASKRLPLSSHPWKMDRDNEKLHLSGVKLDTINAVSVTESGFRLQEGTSDLELAKTWFEWGYNALAPASLEIAFDSDLLTDPEVPRYPLGGNEPLSRACRRTLVADFSLYNHEENGIGRPNQFLFPDDKDERRPDGSLCSHNNTTFDFRFEKWDKRMAVTSKGWIGLVAEEAEVGDRVAVVIGASMPLILRPAPENQLANRDEEQPEEFRLIGHGYIHGLMDGEGLDMTEIEEIVVR